jgi:hypothetical protein
MTEHVLHTLERKVLRISGSIKEREQWRPRWNSYIRGLYKDLNITNDIKIRRIGWAGHIISMEEERI